MNRSGTLTEPLPYEDQHITLGANCHKGVVFQTTKSDVCVQDASLQTERTSNEAFLNNLFSKSDLQKMLTQFTP